MAFSLSEFSRNPSRVTRAADEHGEALLTRRGRVAYRVVAERQESWLDGMVRAGYAAPATAKLPPPSTTVATSVDLDAILAADRGRR